MPNDFEYFCETSQCFEPYYRRGAQGQTKVIKVYTTWGVVMAALAVFIGNDAALSGGAIDWFFCGFLSALAMLCLLSACMHWRKPWDKRAREALSSARQGMRTGYEVGNQKVKICAASIQWTYPHHSVIQEWSGLSRLLETEQQLLLRRIDSGMFILPKRVFDNESEMREIIQFVRKRLAQSPTSDVSMIADYLRGRDYQCPVCRYNLRDYQGENCPECGAILDALTVPSAFALPEPPKFKFFWRVR